MNILQVVLLLVAFYPPAALGTCYRGGYESKFHRTKNRNVNLEALCAYLAGEYKNYDAKKVCMTDTEGRKWDFELSVCAFLFHFSCYSFLFSSHIDVLSHISPKKLFPFRP